jgi:CRP/FNR family transcriptional regulator, cyclic AMP receptor protein
MQRHPDISRYLVNVLAARLRDADEATAAASFLTVKARVARALLELAKHLGEDAGAGRILISITEMLRGAANSYQEKMRHSQAFER